MDFNVFKYYGVDWLLFVLIIIHLWMLGNKRRSAWLVGISICSCSIVFGYLTESLAVILMNVIFVTFHIRNYIKWKHHD